MQLNIACVILIQKQRQLFMKATSAMSLNQSIVQLNQTYSNILERTWTGLLLQP